MLNCLCTCNKVETYVWHCVLCKEFRHYTFLSGEEDSAVYGHLKNGTLDGIIHSQGYAVCGHGIYFVNKSFSIRTYLPKNQLQVAIAFPVISSETYHLEPLSRHLLGNKDAHNVVIYKSSDVVYDLAHTACSSMQSPRLRLIQVR